MPATLMVMPENNHIQANFLWDAHAASQTVDSQRENFLPALVSDRTGAAGQPATLPAIPGQEAAPEATLERIADQSTANQRNLYREKETSPKGLLNFEQEQALARRMAATKSHPGRQREYEQARQTFILANMGLVGSIAHRYQCAGFVLEDLVQEGTLGLIQAVDRFDYHQRVRFSTYATWWIKQAILKAIADRGRVIRLPSHIHDRLRHLQQTRQTLGEKFGRTPTMQELAQAEKMTVEQISQLLAATVSPLSLDAPVGEEHSTSLADLIPAGASDDPLAQVMRQSLGPILQQALQILNRQEQDVVIARYGLDGEEPRSLDELSRAWKRGRERLRQIEVQALQKLRRHSHLKSLAL